MHEWVAFKASGRLLSACSEDTLPFKLDSKNAYWDDRSTDGVGAQDVNFGQFTLQGKSKIDPQQR